MVLQHCSISFNAPPTCLRKCSLEAPLTFLGGRPLLPSGLWSHRPARSTVIRFVQFTLNLLKKRKKKSKITLSGAALLIVSSSENQM